VYEVAFLIGKLITDRKRNIFWMGIILKTLNPEMGSKGIKLLFASLLDQLAIRGYDIFLWHVFYRKIEIEIKSEF